MRLSRLVLALSLAAAARATSAAANDSHSPTSDDHLALAPSSATIPPGPQADPTAVPVQNETALAPEVDVTGASTSTLVAPEPTLPAEPPPASTETAPLDPSPPSEESSPEPLSTSSVSTSTSTSIPTATDASDPEPPSSSGSAIPFDDPAPPPPSPPEFLSFNEWRAKYVVSPDPSARRARKAAQRARQDAVASAGTHEAAFDGDGADFGSLFAAPAGGKEGSQIVYESEEGALIDQLDRMDGVGRAAQMPVQEGTQTLDEAAEGTGVGTSVGSVGSGVIEPLPMVGTGERRDPLVLLKDRSNYALFECAAMVHRASRGTKGASSILVEKKDRYMLTPCSVDHKFVELELCDEIRIDTIVLANFELFSSMFKRFEIKVSQNYPGRPDEWHDLGTFRARNMRGLQVFRPNTSLLGFYRYMRIDFVSHYGYEYYCPVSLLRVYGLTHVDAWRRDEEQANEAKAREAALAELSFEDDDEDDIGSISGEVEFPVVPKKHSWAESGTGGNSSTASMATTATSFKQEKTTAPPNQESSSTTLAEESSTSVSAEATSSLPPSTTTVNPCSSSADPTPTSQLAASSEAPSITLDDQETTSMTPTMTTEAEHSTIPTLASEPPPTLTVPPSSRANPKATSKESSVVSSVVPSSSSNETASTSVAESTESAPSSATPANPSDSAISETVLSSSSTTLSSAASFSSSASPPKPIETVAARHVPRNESHPPPPSSPPRPVIPPPVQQPQPGESIYGTIMKRLGSLEHNQTLSMHYIEAQGAMLREAFSRLDRRLLEVEAGRAKHDQVIRQGLIDLETRYREADRDKLILTSQVSLLRQELLLEKRLGVAQLIGLLALFIFVGVTRGSPTTPFLHMVQTQAFRRRMSNHEEKRSDEVRRDGRRDRASESNGEAFRKQHIQRAGSMSARIPSAKRFSVPKSAPRRHYATAGGPSSNKPSRPLRAWTPPPHPFLNDEAFSSTLSNALRIEASSSRRRVTSPQTLSPLQRPTDEADTERSQSELDEVEPLSTSAQEDGGYRTFSGGSGSDDEAADRTVFVRPPKMVNGRRPSMAPSRSAPAHVPPAPESRLPSPPPEPEPVHDKGTWTPGSGSSDASMNSV